MTEIAAYWPQLLLAWSILFVGVISPGPSVALILGVAVRDGRDKALITVAGIATASLVLALATALGVAALFAHMADAVFLLRIIGGTYLLYLAYKSFRTAITLPPMTLDMRPHGSPARVAVMGFALQMSNPKALFFWLAVASAGGIGDAPMPVIAIFVLGAFLNSLIGHGAYALLLSLNPVRAGYIAARRWIETALGGVFAILGYRLLAERG